MGDKQLLSRIDLEQLLDMVDYQSRAAEELEAPKGAEDVVLSLPPPEGAIASVATEEFDERKPAEPMESGGDEQNWREGL